MTATVHVEVTVNGEKRGADVEGRLLLVHWLRDELGLTGTHVGCDTTNCGACTVHLNGEAVKSCTVLAAQADGSEVTTIEGLARDAGRRLRRPRDEAQGGPPDDHRPGELCRRHVAAGNAVGGARTLAGGARKDRFDRQVRGR